MDQTRGTPAYVRATYANSASRFRGDYLASAFPECDVTCLQYDQIFFFLNDRAERRNEVTHGQANELLSNELLSVYIDFMRPLETLFTNNLR